MPVDNLIYDNLSETWWEGDSIATFIREGINPCRSAYFRKICEKLNYSVEGKKILDLGCGGGYISEDFSRLGGIVTGIDPSNESIRVAKIHAEKTGLNIEYIVNKAEELPFENETFDMVFCCDVLEHVDDLKKTVSEVSRVLKKGGIIFYETINRTFPSKLITIKLLQEWEWTSALPRVHDWDMYITPAEMTAMLKENHIEQKDMIGFGPSTNPVSIILSLRKRKKGKMNFYGLAKALNIKETKDLSINYMGYGIKQN